MTTKLVGALAAGTLALGILVGAAGTVLVHDTTGASLAMSDTGDMGHMGAMRDMGQMHEMMSGMGGSTMGPEASMDPVDHAQHHNGSDQ